MIDGRLVEMQSEQATTLATLAEVPATLGGQARFQVQNALAVAAAGRALGLTFEEVSRGLRSFDPFHQNQGRATFYEVGQGYLVVDYGHNLEAIRAISQMTSQWSGRRVTAILGLPGDRADALIEETARAAAQGFDRVFLAEVGARPAQSWPLALVSEEASAPAKTG